MPKIITQKIPVGPWNGHLFICQTEKLKTILSWIYFCMEHKCLPNFWMALPNLLSMSISAKSCFPLKQKSLYFTASTSAHFGLKAEFVMNGLIWEVPPSTYTGFKLCLSLQRVKMLLWGHTWNYRLGCEQAEVQHMEGTVSPGSNSGQGGGVCHWWALE